MLFGKMLPSDAKHHAIQPCAIDRGNLPARRVRVALASQKQPPHSDWS
jgi:hypothetical protein